MSLLSVADVELRFGGSRAVDQVSFSLGDDELVALIGPNGAGKTALLNCICGIYRPQSGTIRLEGRHLVGLSPHQVARAGVGRSFQHAELFSSLSVRDNLLVAAGRAIPGSLLGASLFTGRYARGEAAAVAEAEELIDFFELERYRTTPVHGLAFGVQKLVDVARALAGKPRILLLDEPSSGLTRQEKEDFARFLLRIRYDRRLPVLWVEHDMQMVTDLADRIVVLDYGRKLAEGTPEEVVNDPQVVMAYTGVSHPETVSRASAES